MKLRFLFLIKIVWAMKELYLWPMNADQVGTPKQIRDVIDGVRENNIQVVFCESTVNTAPAKQVARETGIEYGGVLYVDSLSEKNGEVPTYLDLLKVTSKRVVEGLTSVFAFGGLTELPSLEILSAFC